MRSAAGVLGWSGPAAGHASLSTGAQAGHPALRGPLTRRVEKRPSLARRRRATPALSPRSLRAPLPVSGRRCRGDGPQSAAGPRPSSAAHPVPSPWRCRCPEPCGGPTVLGTGPAVEPVPRGCDARAGTCRRGPGRFARPFSCPGPALARRRGRARAGPEAFVPAWEP